MNVFSFDVIVLYKPNQRRPITIPMHGYSGAEALNSRMGMVWAVDDYGSRDHHIINEKTCDVSYLVLFHVYDGEITHRHFVKQSK